MKNLTGAVKNRAVRRMMVAVEAKAKAEARASVMAEMVAVMAEKVKYGHFDPADFIDDLKMSQQASTKATESLQGEALTALAMLEIDEMMEKAGIVNPQIISQAIEMDNFIKPSLDGSGRLNILVEGKDGRSGVALEQHIQRMRIDAKTSFLFLERDSAKAAPQAHAVMNPWKKETFNLTRQGEITKTNPEMAARFKQEAGAR